VASERTTARETVSDRRLLVGDTSAAEVACEVAKLLGARPQMYPTRRFPAGASLSVLALPSAEVLTPDNSTDNEPTGGTVKVFVAVHPRRSAGAWCRC
jgi:hypothetical protein